MKKLSILLVLTLIISLLSACGGGPEPVEHSAPTETPQQETAVHTAVPEADSMEETAAPADTSTAEATAAPRRPAHHRESDGCHHLGRCCSRHGGHSTFL